MKMLAKVEFITLGCWGEYIGEGSARLELNRGIKSLSFLHYFSEKGHTAHMQVHTGRMLFFFVVNNFF
jgi:hypothetical protein